MSAEIKSNNKLASSQDKRRDPPEFSQDRGVLYRNSIAHFKVLTSTYPSRKIMTNTQWSEICDYVLERLQKEESFEVKVSELKQAFSLNSEFYNAMISHYERDRPRFGFKGPWKDSNGDPTDPIRFWREQ